MASKLSSVVKRVQETDWTQPWNFSVDIRPKDPGFANLCGWTDTVKMQEKIDISIKSINVPQRSCTLIEEYNGVRWYQANSRDELYDVNITFRDFNQGELYRKFVSAFNNTKDNYFEKIKFYISISLCSNDLNQVDPNAKNIKIFETDMALITSVSQLQLSHETKDEILEFDVSFKTNTPYHNEEFIDITKLNLNVDAIRNTLKNKLEQSAKNVISNIIQAGLNTVKNTVKDYLKF